MIATLQARCAAEGDVRTLRIKHNNVLGFSSKWGRAPAGGCCGRVHASSIARRWESAIRFTTSELADLEAKIAGAAGQALDIELAVFDQLAMAVASAAEPIRAVAEALAVLDVSVGAGRAAGEGATAGRRSMPRLCHRRRRHPVVEQALRREDRHRRSSPTTATSRPARIRRAASS